MALNPSNIVQEGFPTLGDAPFNSEARDTALAELEAAGIPRGSSIFTTHEVQVWKEGSDVHEGLAGISFPNMGTEDDKEWITVHSVEAKVFGWKFDRAWYYWMASVYHGAVVPEEEAVRLDEMWGRVLRVDGFAGGKRPQGFVNSYHIDRPDALAALVASLKKADEDRRAKWKRQAEGGT